jgi:hypothetical protein
LMNPLIDNGRYEEAIAIGGRLMRHEVKFVKVFARGAWERALTKKAMRDGPPR